MNANLKIFISSTMDLKKERNAVTDVVSQFQGIPIKMEFFTARSQSSEEVCIEEVTNCDVYVGIFSRRYGFVPTENNSSGSSATVLEFEKARELGIPTLIFIKSNVSRDPKLKQFLDTISDFKKGIFRKRFDNISGLKYWALASLVFHLTKTASEAEERDKLEKLVIDESLYRHYVEETCEHVDLKGIYQLRRVVQLRLNDIYVPLKLKRLVELREQSLQISEEETGIARGIELAVPSLLGLFRPRLVNDGRGGKEATTHPLPLSRDGGEIQEVISANKKMVILGGAGSGKTTLLRHLAGILVRGPDSSLTPILVPLREYSRYLKSGKNLSMLGYLKWYFSSHGLLLSEDFFERHLSSGGCVVMLDGLDEILEERDRIGVASHIEQLGACFGEGNTMVVSSRIPAYRTTQLSGFSHYAIQKLDLNQVYSFISNWFERVEGKKQPGQSKRLFSLISHDANLLSLSMNPLMLSLICLVGIQGIPIPRKRADLYDVCVRTLLSSWEAKKGFKGVLSEPQGFEILKKLAFWFLKERKITATKYEISGFIEAQLEHAGMLKDGRESQAMWLLRNMTARAGFLIEREPNVYGFVHLGLRDYLAAMQLAGMNDVEEMFNSSILPSLHRADYESVICLCSRCLAHQSVSRAQILLGRILDAKTPFEELIHLDLVLATKSLFNSGISYGAPVREILGKMALVLKSPISVERKSMLRVLKEADLELFEDFFCTLIVELEEDIALKVVQEMAMDGKVLEEGEFGNTVLEFLCRKITSSTKPSREVCRTVGYLAARGNSRALELAFEIIESGAESGKSCAEVLVPIARTDPKTLERLLRVVARRGSGLRRHLLLSLYEIASDEVAKRATAIAESEDEDQDLRHAAESILRRHKMTEEEARLQLNAQTEKKIDSILEPKNAPKITDDQAFYTLVLEVPSEIDLRKIMSRVTEIFEVNHILAFRMFQALKDSYFHHPSFAQEVEDFVKHLLETPKTSRRLLAYAFSLLKTPEREKHKALVMELAENEKEFVIARRAALNRLGDTFAQVITEEDCIRLLKLSSDEGVNHNLFSLLIDSPLNKSTLMDTMSKQIEKGQDSIRRPLRILIRQSYE